MQGKHVAEWWELLAYIQYPTSLHFIQINAGIMI